ncbi:hypothetical protein FRC03_002954 [Tulasnella sp. 419]|nr:hypothetical protein FRC03_002954 [Tulasnella sp. 419]
MASATNALSPPSTASSSQSATVIADSTSSIASSSKTKQQDIDTHPVTNDPEKNSRPPSIRSGRSRRSSMSKADSVYGGDHLNDPYYSYPGSFDDLHDNTSAHIRWSNLSFPQSTAEHEKRETDAYHEYDDGVEYDDYWEDDSPYPEVRAAVANTDDPEMPTNTFRMWFLGIIFTILIAGMNQFFSLRYPSVQITALVAQLIALPCGRLLERILPTRQFNTFGYVWSFNPGPWNIKEHTLVTVMANVVSGGAYATDIIASQRTFYDQKWSVTYQLSLVISTQLIGFAFAGICRRFLVWPASMIWPATLVNAALFNTMHAMYLDDETEDFYAEQEEQVQAGGFEMTSTAAPTVIDESGNPINQAPMTVAPKPDHFQSGTSEKPAVINFAARARAVITRPFRRWINSSTSVPDAQQQARNRRKRKRNSRSILFTRTLILSALWNFFPAYIFTALSAFTPLCWIFSSSDSASTPAKSNGSVGVGTDGPSISTTPGTTMGTALGASSTTAGASTTPKRNIIINQLFGYTHGLGMGFLTFDWAMIAYNGSPLVTPWWAELNVFVTLVVVFWIIAPIMYYKNVFFSHYLPMSSSGSYDNTGNDYDSRRIVVDGVFRPDLYKEYSPLYIPVTFALSYGLSFGALTATVVHTLLWYRKDIRRQFTWSLKDSSQEDIHARLMLAYPEVPQWWYATIGIFAFVLGLITIEVWDTKLPFWAYVVAILISIVYLVPIGMIQAITNMQVGLNVITELIVGYALPGRPVAMMIFKTFGYITMAQALSFVSDLKLGHYMKIPPRMMFLTQTVAALIACFVVVGVQAWMFGNIPGLCERDQPDKFTCPSVRVFSTASLIWGGIGPARAFNFGNLYYPMLYFFPIGALLPIPFWYLARKYPRSWYKYVNIPVCFTGLGNLPPATGINYASWTIVGFIFQYWIRRHNFRWWSRYNYIFSAGLDAGVAIGTMLVFFTLAYPRDGKIELNWWGNSVGTKTPDYLGTPLNTVAPGETFGLREWS